MIMVIDVYTRYLALLHHMSEPFIILLFHINPHTNTHFALYIYMYIHCLCSSRLPWYLPMSLLPSQPLHGKSHANVFSVVCLYQNPSIFHLRSFIICICYCLSTSILRFVKRYSILTIIYLLVFCFSFRSLLHLTQYYEIKGF